jgi:2-dehydro-3-deoxyphosphogluconate aldolase/(4S)-4-hydroxy-2-oxoglutarate aldolase
MQQKMLIGAGTVLDAPAAKQAIEAGAEFIVAPSVDIPTIQLTKEMGRVSIPGAFTATEIVLAHKAGADIVKVFPASNPQYIKDLRGPLGHIPMMPTGGVNLQNIRAFHQAGAVAFGIGSALVDAQQMPTPEYLEQLVAKAASFVSALGSND